MNEYFLKLKNLAMKNRVHPAELVILSTLDSFKTFVEQGIQISEFDTIFGYLIRFLHLNDGKISFQCSIRIAECIKMLCKTVGNKINTKILISISSFLDFATIIATGYLIQGFFDNILSFIPSFISSLLLMNKSNLSAVLYSLTSCFTKFDNNLLQYGNQILNFAEKSFSEEKESIQLFSLKLIRRLQKSKYINNEEIFNFL